MLSFHPFHTREDQVIMTQNFLEIGLIHGRDRWLLGIHVVIVLSAFPFEKLLPPFSLFLFHFVLEEGTPKKFHRKKIAEEVVQYTLKINTYILELCDWDSFNCFLSLFYKLIWLDQIWDGTTSKTNLTALSPKDMI